MLRIRIDEIQLDGEDKRVQVSIIRDSITAPAALLREGEEIVVETVARFQT